MEGGQDISIGRWTGGGGRYVSYMIDKSVHPYWEGWGAERRLEGLRAGT